MGEFSPVFLRRLAKFPLGPQLASAARAGSGITLGVDHPEYQARVVLGPATLETPRDDLA